MRIIYCYNEYTYRLAEKIMECDSGVIAITSSPRFNKNKFKTRLSRKFSYSPLLAVAVAFLSALTKRVEVVIPHTTGGRIVQILLRYSKNLSFIDDGLDTFREASKNFDFGRIFQDKPRFYTYDYGISLAPWLNFFDVIEVEGSRSRLLGTHYGTLISQYDYMIVESPGLNFVSVPMHLKEKIVYIRHPSAVKRGSIPSGLRAVEGKEINLERAAVDFCGDIYIGESIVLLVLFLFKKDLSRVNISLTCDQFNNLKSFHVFFGRCGSLSVDAEVLDLSGSN